MGLGNPGREYLRTRHNIGFEIVNRLAEEAEIKFSRERFSSLWGKGEVEGHPVGLLLPQTYMNRSGRAVREALGGCGLGVEPLSRLMVVHDDLDLDLGKIKLARDSGAAGHRGVLSIIESVGSRSFCRLRTGIGRPENKEEIENYVLSPFGKEDSEAVEDMIKKGAGLLRQWILEEIL